MRTVLFFFFKHFRRQAAPAKNDGFSFRCALNARNFARLQNNSSLQREYQIYEHEQKLVEQLEFFSLAQCTICNRIPTKVINGKETISAYSRNVRTMKQAFT